MFWSWGLLAAFCAGLWLWAFYRADRNPEPRRWMAWGCLGGVMAYFAAALLEKLALQWRSASASHGRPATDRYLRGPGRVTAIPVLTKDSGLEYNNPLSVKVYETWLRH